MIPAGVYRIRDDNGRLIYVGLTRNLDERMALHERFSWWFSLAADVSYEPHPDIFGARAAEAVAIQEEQPAFNVAHTGRAEGDWSHLTANDLATARRWAETAPAYCLFRARSVLEYGRHVAAA